MRASRPHALLFGPDHFFHLQGRLRLRRGELLQSAVLIPERVKFLGLGAKQFRFGTKFSQLIQLSVRSRVVRLGGQVCKAPVVRRELRQLPRLLSR